MKPLKHNKLRNTGLIFDLLVRKLTNDVFSDITESRNYIILKKYFKEGTELSKELQLYKLLSETKVQDESRINYIFDSSFQVKDQLDERKLSKEKYNLISELKTLYGDNLSEFFNTRSNMYKTYASIYKVLEHDISENVEDFLESRFFITESLKHGDANIVDEYQSSDMKEAVRLFKEQDKDTQTLMFKKLVIDFNKRAKKTLIPEQIEFLQSYTFKDNSQSNFSKLFIEVITKSEDQLKTAINTIDDEVMKVKLTEVLRMIKSIKSKKILKESHIISVMKYIKLNNELKNLVNATNMNNKLIGKGK